VLILVGMVMDCRCDVLVGCGIGLDGVLGAVVGREVSVSWRDTRYVAPFWFSDPFTDCLNFKFSEICTWVTSLALMVVRWVVER
jgi:hypothetical protein